MFFIILLLLAAGTIAGSAGYFSVYGLANTFHGTFWSVVIMGGSLEYGKLVAASYLYRYWNKTHFILKTYLISGIITLMIVTSMGIFGYLSTGYQLDALPLKQLEQKVRLLEEEKLRSLDRKKQIDNQIANLPADYSKSRIKLMDSFKSEQEQVTNRINELDKEILDIKSKVINTEAHIGPISYIAKAFHMNTDDATKYLIYLIIFVFDPMAIALTLAVNISLRARREEKEGINEDLSKLEPVYVDEDSYDIPLKEPDPDPNDLIWEEQEPIIEKPISYAADYIKPTKISLEKYKPPFVPTPEQPYVAPPPRRIRPYAGVGINVPIEELLSQHQYYKTKEDQGDIFTPDEQWAYQAIKNALKNQGYNIYI
jgi:hypothetical protein